MNFPFPASPFPCFGIVAAAFLLAVNPLRASETPPPAFTRALSQGGTTLTVDFSHYPIRNGNFAVLVQQADGSYVTHAADVPRTYLGSVRERPGHPQAQSGTRQLRQRQPHHRR